jgi:hypothetical protein
MYDYTRRGEKVQLFSPALPTTNSVYSQKGDEFAVHATSAVSAGTRRDNYEMTPLTRHGSSKKE